MTQSNTDGRAGHGKSRSGPGSGRRARSKPGSGNQGELPGWTHGLRQLYDRVVEEDLPDSFRDLIARLDDQS